MSPCFRGLRCPRLPPQGQCMGVRDVCLMPAPDASHSPALSSWFRLLHCLDKSSHADRVSRAGQQLSLPKTRAEALKMMKGQRLPWLPVPRSVRTQERVQGSSWDTTQPRTCPGLWLPS